MVNLPSSEFVVKIRQRLIIGYLFFLRETDLDTPIKSRTEMSSRAEKAFKSLFFVSSFM